MEKLFNDSEVFIKDRPTKITDEQAEVIWKKLANEVIDNQWSNDDEESIIKDLKKLSSRDNGYDKAKELESLNSLCNYDIDSEFVEWLDWLEDDFNDQQTKNIKQWVIAHAIKPKYEVGTCLIVQKRFTRGKEISVGEEIYINSIREDEAIYCVSTVKGSTSNYLIEYERIEESCVKLTDK